MARGSHWVEPTAAPRAVRLRPPLRRGVGARTTYDAAASVCADTGAVLCRVCTDYRKVKIRWIDAVRKRYTHELNASQKIRFLARIGSRALDHSPNND